MKTAPITIRDDGKCGIIRAEKEFFERDCILRVVSEYAPACFISFYPDSETSIEICIRTKDGSVITEALLRQFFNDCIDAQIRIDLESRWRECFLCLGYNAYPYFRAFCGISRETPTGKFSPDDAWAEQYFKLEQELEHCPESCLLDLLPLLFGMVSKALRKTDRNSAEIEQIKEACRFLSSDFREKREIQEFCRTHGWGYENFRKKFAEIVGVSPNRYRMNRRHEAACALLLRKSLTIGDIAAELGYSSPHEFSAKFKQRTGMTPTQFRDSNTSLLE